MAHAHVDLVYITMAREQVCLMLIVLALMSRQQFMLQQRMGTIGSGTRAASSMVSTDLRCLQLLDDGERAVSCVLQGRSAEQTQPIGVPLLEG